MPNTVISTIIIYSAPNFSTKPSKSSANSQHTLPSPSHNSRNPSTSFSNSYHGKSDKAHNFNNTAIEPPILKLPSIQIETTSLDSEVDQRSISQPGTPSTNRIPKSQSFQIQPATSSNFGHSHQRNNSTNSKHSTLSVDHSHHSNQLGVESHQKSASTLNLYKSNLSLYSDSPSRKSSHISNNSSRSKTFEPFPILTFEKSRNYKLTTHLKIKTNQNLKFEIGQVTSRSIYGQTCIKIKDRKDRVALIMKEVLKGPNKSSRGRKKDKSTTPKSQVETADIGHDVSLDKMEKMNYGGVENSPRVDRKNYNPVFNLTENYGQLRGNLGK